MSTPPESALVIQLHQAVEADDIDFGVYASDLAPACLALREWSVYEVQLPGADGLLVGDREVKPVGGRSDWFRFQFRNQLGLARLQPLSAGRPVGEPVFVEVISSKFSPVQKHVSFCQKLLQDLFEKFPSLPFTASTDTSRNAGESLRPPTPLFTYHFLRQYRETLQNSAAMILSDPHRLLTSYDDRVPLGEATEVDGDVIGAILCSPDTWAASSRGFLIAQDGRRFLPSRVWQRRPEETFDTPENRFILHFLTVLLQASTALPAQPWWQYVPESAQTEVSGLIEWLGRIIAHPVFAGVGELHSIPSQSRTLQRREGYREMFGLWNQFHQARLPVFEMLDQAIPVRDVATLYEVWVFFKLVEQIEAVYGVRGQPEYKFSDRFGLDWGSKIVFPGCGSLIYNRTCQHGKRSYSVALRPDFIWEPASKAAHSRVILDAKFRLTIVEKAAMQLEDDLPEGDDVLADSHNGRVSIGPVRDDLFTMNGYRDALQARAAVILYPGDFSVFYSVDNAKIDLKKGEAGLKQLLQGESMMRGIGALPFVIHQKG